MKRTDVLFLRDRDNKVHAVDKKSIKYDVPVTDLLRKCNKPMSVFELHEKAGDYCIFNRNHGMPEMLEEGSKIFGEKFKSIRYGIEQSRQFEGKIFSVYNLNELSLADKKNEIIEFIGNWDNKNSVYQMCDYYLHNNIYNIISSDSAALTATMERMTDSESSKYLDALETGYIRRYPELSDETAIDWGKTPRATEKGGVWNNIKSLPQSLADKLLSETITLRDAAVSLHQAGWVNFIDEKECLKILANHTGLQESDLPQVSDVKVGSKRLVVGNKNATLYVDGNKHVLSDLIPLLQKYHVNHSDIRDWSEFLKGNPIPLNTEIAIHLKKGAAGYTTRRCNAEIIRDSFTDIKQVLIQQKLDDCTANLNATIEDLQVKDNIFVNLNYHIDYGNNVIEDKNCSVKLSDTLKAFEVKDVQSLYDKIADGHLGSDVWESLTSELESKGLSPSLDETGKYLDFDPCMIPDDY